jgi:transposase-like protein
MIIEIKKSIAYRPILMTDVSRRWYRQLKSPILIKLADEYIQTTQVPAGRPPPDIISYAVWLYYRFNLSHRRCAGPFIEDLLAERGIVVSYESIRLWCIKFGAVYTRRLKRKHRGYGDTFYIDEVFVKINGKQHYLWRAVDQDGEVVDVFLQTKRDGIAVTTRLRNASSKGYCAVMAEIPGRS